MARLGMLIDLRTCIGCHACSVACKAEFDVPLGVFRDTVKYVEAGTYPQATRHFLPILCKQCEEAPCLKACPTGAVIRLENGEVVINKGDFDVLPMAEARGFLGELTQDFQVQVLVGRPCGLLPYPVPGRAIRPLSLSLKNNESLQRFLRDVHHFTWQTACHNAQC